MTGAECAEICREAHNAGLPVHMDGARIFNASVAAGEPVAELTKDCDSVQFCLSKGLGAPVGSVLLGTKDFIDQARIWRKRLGGGMRQVGILAAAGLIALEETPEILHIDHENARLLAEGLAGLNGIEVDVERVMTNIVILDVAGTGKSQQEICDELERAGVRAIGWDTKIRMVTHYDVSRSDVENTVAIMRRHSWLRRKFTGIWGWKGYAG